MSTYINTLFFGEEYKSNSCPIKFTCLNNKVYYVKIAPSETNFDDLIYEALAIHLAALFEIPTPEYDIINVVPDSYNIDDIQTNYNKKFITKNNVAFGSLNIPNHDILGPANSTIRNKHTYNKFVNPIDFLKIGLFDFHISNTDRSESNYNILFDLNSVQGKMKFIAIDHVAIFGGNLFKNTFVPRCDDNLVCNILNTTYGKKIISYLKMDFGDEILSRTIESYFSKIDNIPTIINSFFATIPQEWRYNDELPERIINYLINADRIVHLRSELYSLLKISK